jgi:hypothetical protein
MAAATLKLGGHKFIVLPESEYRQLKAQAVRNGKSVRAKRRPSRQERGDIAEARRALADPRRIPADQVFRKLGI